jgi:hypothetical protein
VFSASPEGSHAEEPFELPAELRWALVADRPRGGARVVPVVGHEPPRLVTAQKRSAGNVDAARPGSLKACALR